MLFKSKLIKTECESSATGDVTTASFSLLSNSAVLKVEGTVGTHQVKLQRNILWTPV